MDALLVNVSVALEAPEALGVKVTVKGADWPAAMVAGRVIPESTNSLLLLPAEETITEAPAAVKLPFREALAPTVTVPKLSVAGETDSCPWAVAVPESGMLSGEFEAFDTTERVPLLEPEAVGAKVAVKVTLWLEVSVVGRVSPVIEKPVPVTLACEIVTEEPPVLVSVSDKFVLLPTATLPNARLTGLALNVPGVTPVPESGMVRLGFAPLEVTVRVPEAVPATVGAKTKL